MTIHETFTLDEVYNLSALRADIHRELTTQAIKMDEFAKIINFPRARVRAFMLGKNQPGWTADMVLTMADWVGKDPGFYVRSSLDEAPAQDWYPMETLLDDSLLGDGGTEPSACGLQPITTEQKVAGLKESLQGIQSMGHRIAPGAPEVPQKASDPSPQMEHKGSPKVALPEPLVRLARKETFTTKALAATVVILALRSLIRG